MDISGKAWEDIARDCPLECEIANTEGKLWVEEDEYGWTFHHPGLNEEGEIFIHAFSGDTTPSSDGLTINKT